jgi:hypothetical protein
MVTYQDYAKDLRTLADILDAHADDLPMPMHPSVLMDITIHVLEARDVEQAARALEVPLERGNHTTTTKALGTVQLRFVHIDNASMARYDARNSYANNLRVTS